MLAMAGWCLSNHQEPAIDNFCPRALALDAFGVAVLASIPVRRKKRLTTRWIRNPLGNCRSSRWRSGWVEGVTKQAEAHAQLGTGFSPPGTHA